jgi:endonuclease/exonuclease/phosphatase family metal-dependent hydrolase
MQFRLITYNIHKGIGGVDRRYRLERIIETLRHYDPDVVFLQEVDDGVKRSRRHCQVDMLSEALQLKHSAYQPNVLLREGQYGNALLSRYPLRDVHDVDLSLPLKKRRRAQGAHCVLRIEEHTRTLLLYNLHLGLAGFERRIQVRRLLRSAVLSRTHRDTAVVVAGDFNDTWKTVNRRFMRPDGFHSASGTTKSFPAVRPIRALDQIYYRGQLSLHHCFPGRLRLARLASDHLPVIAEFEVH